ncbi:MAG: nitrate reductase cytochrome c-type subunit [Betaproteobacteria bacterium]|nr:nitrate reductase cytochrome c-type subunit [Betaproteobacteria bacterium]
MKKYLLVAGLAAWIITAVAQTSGSLNNGLRGPASLDREGPAPAMPKPVNDDVRKGRAFAMQPPVIPHQIDNYQIDKNFNKCMTCHGRERTQESQAPMVSVTHFMDREGNFRSEISPRRYFCTQCHAAQMEVKPPVENRFIDAEKATSASKGKTK